MAGFPTVPSDTRFIGIPDLVRSRSTLLPLFLADAEEAVYFFPTEPDTPRGSDWLVGAYTD